ncbi:MAG TPA: ATP-dependent DNA helicase UvrD2 [Acidimicrobiia bacterium]|nr:ATP-dependent DNA helicase UvrD2 [Acidimicrobiia bacterium]
MDELLRGLDASQRDAVTSPAAPLAILAGAGSGKTRVLTRRIAWQAREERADPRHVLAVTFTRKAAGELRARLERLGVQHAVTAGTFHAIALAQLRRRAEQERRPVPALLDRKARLLVPILRLPGREAGLAAAEVASEIEWAKARLIRPEGYVEAVAGAGRTPPRPAPQVADVYREYERQKRRRGLLDFDDLIWECAAAFEHDPEFAAAQRWRFQHLFVDEFQDASPAQFRLLQAWLGERADLCVVGDADQAIYGFAGADPSYLARFRAYFPSERFPATGVVRLGSNYRSTPQVVAAAGALLESKNPGRSVRATRPAGPEPTITEHESDVQEARGVARALRDVHAGGVSWPRLAVLYRINAQSALFEEALAAARVPFRVRGNARFLDRPEVALALDELRTSARTAPGRSFAEHLDDLAHPDDGDALSDERREHVDALFRLGHEYVEAEGGTGSVDGFLGYLHATLRGDDADAGVSAGDAVELLTFHRAKGLEFHTVFVTGLERGLVPISHAKTRAALDEEQRLLYVALSRAEHDLRLSWAAQRTVGARLASRSPSPWLARIERALPGAAGREPAAPADARVHLADARSHVGKGGRAARDVPDSDAPLFAALVEWRRRLARAAGTPAYVVFSNATLAAIAAARPRTRRALLGVPGVGPVKADRYGEAVLALVVAEEA